MFRTIKRITTTGLMVTALMYIGDKYEVSRPIDGVIHAYNNAARISADYEQYGPEGTIDYVVDRVLERLQQ